MGKECFRPNQCKHLHICRKLVSGIRCNKSNCRLDHTFQTDHNRNVMKLNSIQIDPDLLLKFYLVSK